MTYTNKASGPSEIIMESVRERDIDLLLMRALADRTAVGENMLRGLFGSDYSLKLVQHSRYDETGESDIMLMVNAPTHGRIAVFIEDKIDASPQPEQCERYIIRGNKMLKDEECDAYEIVLIAPEKYLASSKAAGYEKSFSYEYLRSLCEPGSFEHFILSEAIEKQRKGYTPVKDEKVTVFWEQLYLYIENNYPNLTPYITKGDRGSQATWIPFRIDMPDARIQIKADRGYTDLEIGHQSKHIRAFAEENRQVLKELKVYPAGESVAVRMKTPELDFHKSFESQITLLDACLKACEELQDLSKEIIRVHSDNI